MPRKSKSHSENSSRRSSRSHSSHSDSDSGKVGESPAAARKIGGKGDFGARESDPIERSYASLATRNQDKGGGIEHSIGDGVRTSGVGGNDSGPGSSSGGDIDPDIIGVGTGGSTLPASGRIEEPPGADDVRDNTRKSDRSKSPKRRTGKATIGKGSTVNRDGGDLSTTGSGQGSSAMTNPMDGDDDSFAGEISNDEAAGADNSLSDNS